MRLYMLEKSPQAQGKCEACRGAVKLIPYIHGGIHVAVLNSTLVLFSLKEHLGLCQQLLKACHIC